MHGFIESLGHAVMITSFVFAMMVLVDYVNVFTRGKMSQIIQGGRLRQYVGASFLGATPGCLGSFMNVSFYIRGIITFGAVTGGMAATCGDGAFMMLALFPQKALLLFAILFGIGIIVAYLSDWFVERFRVRTCEGCGESHYHQGESCCTAKFGEILNHLRRLSMRRFLFMLLLAIFLYGFFSGIIGPEHWDWKRISFIVILGFTFFVALTVPEHYLEEHIWEHIVKKHLWRIMLWSFGALLIIHLGLEWFNLETFVENHMVWVLILALLIGLIPDSGPHLIFVVLFAKGMIPFSVLLASSIVQDGHGMLPLLSHSVKDSLLIKIINLTIGLIVGLTLYLAGL